MPYSSNLSSNSNESKGKIKSTDGGDGTDSEDEDHLSDAHDAGSEQKLSAAAIFREEFTDFDMHVSFCSTAGDRAHMEDVCVHAHNYFNHCPEDAVRRPYHYFAVFDGHGGRHASEFVSTHLLDFITQQPGFWRYDNDRSVMQAIYDGFLHCHVIMWKHALPTWPLLPNGHRSTAGTTASVAILRDSKLYIGHVGDSGIVLVERRMQNESTDAAAQPSPLLCAHRLTEDHKPESPEELERIHGAGGSVRAKQGVHRVVWKRPLLVPVGTASQQESSSSAQQYVVKYSIIPFLAVARSLGDFWSFNPESNDFIVSPAPDISCINLQWPRHRGLVIGSDGLWNFCRAEEAVELVEEVDRLREMWFWQMAMMSSAAAKKRKQQSSSLSSSPTRLCLRRQRSSGREQHRLRSASQASLLHGTGEDVKPQHYRAASLLSLPSVFSDGSTNGVHAETRSRHSTGGCTRASVNSSSVAESGSVYSDTNNTSTDDESMYADDDSDDDADTTTTTTDDAESLASLELQSLQREANDVNVADCIIHKVVGRCSARHLRADNIAVFVVLFEPKSSSAAKARVGIQSRNSMHSADSIFNDDDNEDNKCAVEIEHKSEHGSTSELPLDTSTVFSSAKGSTEDLTTASSSSSVGSATSGRSAPESVNDGLDFRGAQQQLFYDEEQQENSEAVAAESHDVMALRQQKISAERAGGRSTSGTKLSGTLHLMKRHLRRNGRRHKHQISTSTCKSEHRHAIKSVNGVDTATEPPKTNDTVDAAVDINSRRNSMAANHDNVLIAKQLSPEVADEHAAAAAEPTSPVHSPAVGDTTNFARKFKLHRGSRKRTSTNSVATKNVFLSSPLDAVVRYESTMERLHSLLRPPVDHNPHAATLRQQFLDNAVKSTTGVQFYVRTHRNSNHGAGSSSESILSSSHRVEEKASPKSDENNENKRKRQVKDNTPFASTNFLDDTEKHPDQRDDAATPPPLDKTATPPPVPPKADDFRKTNQKNHNDQRKRTHCVSSNAKRKRHLRRHHRSKHEAYYYRQLHIHNANTFGPKQALRRMLGQVQAGFTQQHRALFNSLPVTINNNTVAVSNTSNGDHASAGKITQNETTPAPSPPSLMLPTTACRVMGVKSLKKNSVKPFNIPLSASCVDNSSNSAAFRKEGSTSKFDFLPYQPPPLPLPRAVAPPSTTAPSQPLPSSTSSLAHRHNHHHYSNGGYQPTGNWFLPISSYGHHPRTSYSFATRPAVRPQAPSAPPYAPPKN